MFYEPDGNGGTDYSNSDELVNFYGLDRKTSGASAVVDVYLGSFPPDENGQPQYGGVQFGNTIALSIPEYLGNNDYIFTHEMGSSALCVIGHVAQRTRLRSSSNPARPPVHLPLQHLEPVDLPFGLTAAPRLLQRCAHRGVVPAQPLAERHDHADPACAARLEPLV